MDRSGKPAATAPAGPPSPTAPADPPSPTAPAAGPLSLYVHLPWCRSRCGYCDFNTYVADPDEAYLAALRAELALAADSLGARRVTTVYFGGGTPTLLDPAAFADLLATVARLFDLDPAAEVTSEANPETLSPAYLAALRQAGVDRLSLGMQSAVPHVLAVLDRVHTPGRALEAATWARAAGFANVSLDLIYGAPGESMADWTATLAAALGARPDHVSAYSLIVEPGTRLAARMARGEAPFPDDDLAADKYLAADEALSAAGLGWYELSNWGEPCRHNLAYWLSGDWWGVGAGAHSHVGGVRWWNVRHPAAYTARLQAGSPADGSETLTPEQRRTERVLLELRLSSGLDLDVLTTTERSRVPELVERGLVAVVGPGSSPGKRPHAPLGVTDGLGVTDRLGVNDGLGVTDRESPEMTRQVRPAIVLSQRGRLLADAVTRDLLD